MAPIVSRPLYSRAYRLEEHRLRARRPQGRPHAWVDGQDTHAVDDRGGIGRGQEMRSDPRYPSGGLRRDLHPRKQERARRGRGAPSHPRRAQDDEGWRGRDEHAVPPREGSPDLILRARRERAADEHGPPDPRAGVDGPSPLHPLHAVRLPRRGAAPDKENDAEQERQPERDRVEASHVHTIHQPYLSATGYVIEIGVGPAAHEAHGGGVRDPRADRVGARPTDPGAMREDVAYPAGAQ